MHRFFCSPQNITSQEITILDKDELHHIKDVLRLKSQDKIIVIDGEGREFTAQILKIDKSQSTLKIINKRIYDKRDLSLSLTVACALPKKSKINFIVEKLTELGVEKIILLSTERTQIKLKQISDKIDKLKRVSIEALKQSQAKFLPKIEFMKFADLLKIKGDFDLALLPNLGKGTVSFRSVLDKFTKKNILVAVGPEGDFSKNEIGLAKQAGFIPVSLGDTILKVDTAAIVVAGFIKLYLCDSK